MNDSNDESTDEDFSFQSNRDSDESSDDELSDVGRSEAGDLIHVELNDEEDEDDSSYDENGEDTLIEADAGGDRYWDMDLEDFYDDMDCESGLMIRYDPETHKTSISVKLSRDDPTPPSDDELVRLLEDPTATIDEILLDGTSLNRQRLGEGGWVITRRVCDSLARLISKSAHLESMELRFVEFESVRPITRSLRENRSIRNLCLSCMDSGVLWRGLEQMDKLESLDISGFPLHGQALQNLLTNTTSLDRLSIFGNSDGQSAVFPYLCEGLTKNDTLTRLSLQRGSMDEDGANALAKALTVNTKLSHLVLGLNRTGVARKNVLRAIGQHLPQMNGLRSLWIKNDNFDLHNLVVFMLGLELNKSLTSCTMATLSFLSDKSPMLALLNFYMDLNKAHRGDVIGHESNIPLPLWPHILARTVRHGPSVLFHFVREEPALFKRVVLM